MLPGCLAFGRAVRTRLAKNGSIRGHGWTQPRESARVGLRFLSAGIVMNTVVNPKDVPSEFDARQLADQLAAAGRDGVFLEASGLAVPDSIDEAIAVQMLLLDQARPLEITWKIAMTQSGDGVRAPMFPLIDQAVSTMDWPYHSGQRLEVEIGLRLATALPVRPDAGYTRADIAAAVGAVFLGIEVLEKRMSGTPDYLLRYADRLDNGGYIIGPQLPSALLDTVGGMPLQVSAAGQIIFDAPAGHPKGDVLSWVLAFANNPHRPADSLQAGEFVTTGSLCGAVDLPAAGEVRCTLDGELRMQAMFR